MRKIIILISFFFTTPFFVQAQNVPTPKSHFGFSIGDNYHLATFTQTEGYLNKIAATSKKVKLQVIVPTTFELEIVDKELWKSKKDEFFSQCNSEKDMGSYIHTDYCEEEYGIRMLEENIKEDTNNKEYGEIIQTWDENGKAR